MAEKRLEEKLHDRLNDVDELMHYAQLREDAERKGWLAVHIQLSKLRPETRTANQLRIAAETVEHLLDTHEGKMFMMPAGDIILYVKNAAQQDVDPFITRLRYLFSEDPLFVGSAIDDSSRFVTWYNLVTEYRALNTRVKGLYQQGIKDRDAVMEEKKRAQTAGLRPIEPRHLEQIEGALENADLSNMIQRQAICLFSSEGQFRPVFSELFVSVAKLNKVLMAEVVMTSNRWLFQYLTNLLDQRMLAFLLRMNEPQFRKAFSLNINVSTLLSPEFKKFDDKIRPEAKRTVMFELQAIDVYADMGTFVFARDTLQEKGYRFCLDGLNHLTLPLVDRRALGLDLLKINWSTEMLDDPTGKLEKKMHNLVSQAVPSRVILARCDSPDAVIFGRKLGISLFQGRFLDKIISGEVRAPAALYT